MRDVDTTRDSKIDVDEFFKGISRCNKAKRAAMMDCGKVPLSMKLFDDFDKEDIINANWHASKAVLMLLLGTIVAAVIADPPVDAVDNFLFLKGSSEIVSTLNFVSQKKQRTASLAYSEIYGSVRMSNIFSLVVFLALVYI
ncbi:hypothetical protein RchiOBHm_Chr2g0129121 [Rosa chinensis]|uniref:EF-hand domain-containing protein n=1 Tax=Rosa chinensis TaxID=74649 RepID=A0A2P6RUI6_ROSCH|nr:hypothetical protein RchiOBHm_Chr2g0129121 [Rosa chinensis]